MPPARPWAADPTGRRAAVAVTRRVALTGFAAVLAGCAGWPMRALPPPPPPASPAAREAQMQARWRGQTYQALLDDWGPPRTLLAIPDRDRQYVAVFVRPDNVPGCVDAFVIAADADGVAREVLDYFCR